jgi:hypothetical protein
VIAVAVAAITLTRGPVAESVTHRSAIISFRTSARDHDSVLLQNGDRIDAGTGVSHVAKLSRLSPVSTTSTRSREDPVLSPPARSAPRR